MNNLENTIESLLSFTNGKKYNTIYADPPWQFQNRTGKVAPEHKRLARYETMSLQDIKALPVSDIADEKAHLYLWVPNALLPEGLAVMDASGFDYKGNIVWEKIRKDGFPDGRGVGFYFRNVFVRVDREGGGVPPIQLIGTLTPGTRLTLLPR